MSSATLPVSSTGSGGPTTRVPDPEASGTPFVSGVGHGVTETVGLEGVSSVRPLLRGSLSGGELWSPDSSSSSVSIPPSSSVGGRLHMIPEHNVIDSGNNEKN